MDHLIAFFHAKIGLFLSGLAGGILSILVTKDASWWAVTAAIGSGVFLAIVATEPTVDFWNLPDNYAHGVAGFYGIVGRSLLVWVIKISQNPETLINLFRKK